MRKPAFCICENKDPDAVTTELISDFVFATRILQSLYFLNPKYQASSHLLWQYSLVCVGPGQRKTKTGFLTRLIWNSLPQKLREITSIEQFRSQVGTWSGGYAHARSFQTVKFYVHLSVVFFFFFFC